MMSRRIASAFLRFTSIGVIVVLICSFGCDEQLAPFRLYYTSSSLGLCPNPPLIKVPSMLLSSEFRNSLMPLSAELPSTVTMSSRRLDLGKIMVAIKNAGTYGSEQRLEAVRKFDDQAKRTIRSIAKFSFASQLMAETCARILSGLIETLEGAPGQSTTKRRAIITVVSLQDQANAWVVSLQDQLRSFYEQSMATKNDLDSCYVHFRQIFQIPGDTIEGEEIYLADAQQADDLGWLLTADVLGINPQRVRPPLARAMQDFEALVKELMKAHQLVSKQPSRLLGVIRGIEAAYRDDEKSLIINMDLWYQVEMTIGRLGEIKHDLEKAKS
ncbi:hypothetical protein D9756_005197 [Leucocoprinus leucothites]|uniref:Uncharacterized protein n=1 Tax=Leucocoprinus leucothites TaxID=201217 RepID=A0A8H5LKN1_9AGAR|nr:hypothetical protein D9756_005197 [Leucoagaricus leucothites]